MCKIINDVQTFDCSKFCFIYLFYMDNIAYMFPWNKSYSININNLIKYVYNLYIFTFVCIVELEPGISIH